MELSYDCRNFSDTFYPRRRVNAQGQTNPIFYVSRKVGGSELVVSAFAEGDDLSDWIGMPIEDFKANFELREVVEFAAKDLDLWTKESQDFSHYYDQRNHLLKSARNSGLSKTQTQLFDPQQTQHFLFNALQGWWRHFMPASHGIFIRKEGEEQQDFLVLLQRGEFQSFHKPDLTRLSAERARDSASVVRYLNEKHMLPILGIFVSAAEWDEWCQQQDPWKQVAEALKTKQLKLAPCTLGMRLLIGLRGKFGI